MFYPTAGQDYVAETATIRFDPINTEPIICERITLIDDSVNEPSEMFFADLSTSDPAVVFLVSTTAITILDDDRESLCVCVCVCGSVTTVHTCPHMHTHTSTAPVVIGFSAPHSPYWKVNPLPTPPQWLRCVWTSLALSLVSSPSMSPAYRIRHKVSHSPP